MKKTLLTMFMCLYISAPVFALDGNEMLKKVDRNLNPESFEMYRKLINIESDGSKKEFVMYSVKKGKDKIASVFLSPASEKGRSTLRIGENMWLYIPNVGKPIRITSLQSVTGGVFNNSDIMRVDYSTEYNCEKVEPVDEKHILHLKAKTNTVAYDKVKMWVYGKRLLPDKLECFASSGMIIKTLYFKNIKDFGNGIVRPAVIETDSPLYKGYKSIIVFAKVKVKDLPDEVFTLNYMSKVEGLRQ
ncbi:MAG: outer membrane lipoprotein-sorting protein [Desulfobacterales bacterium]|jgi:outer membrane lipoprotein-sorting protein|nr:outer membrane lipoprotein-sorting protein [Desulfobacterales bacterium]